MTEKINYRSDLLNDLKNNIGYAARYLSAAIADSQEAFLVALRDVAEAHKMARVAEEAKVSRESLYRALSKEGNPRFSTLGSVLDALGMILTIHLKEPTPSQPAPASQIGGQTFSKKNIRPFELTRAWTSTQNVFMNSAISKVDEFFARESMGEQIPADVPVIPSYVAATGLGQQNQAGQR